MSRHSVFSIAVTLGVVALGLPQAFAATGSSSDMGVAHVLFSAIVGDPKLNPPDRIVYYENFILKGQVPKAGEAPHNPLSIDVPIMAIAPGDAEPVQMVVGYTGNANEAIALAPRSVSAGSPIEVKFGIPDFKAMTKNDSIDKICSATPSMLDRDSIFRKYFTCRRIVVDTTDDGLGTFKALKGWWDASYNLTTPASSFIAVDQDVVARVQNYMADSKYFDRFYKIFSKDNVSREMGEMQTRELQDERFVGIFIRRGRLDDARLLNDRLLRDYDALPNGMKTAKYYGVDRAKLVANQRFIQNLLDGSPTQ